MIMTLATNTGYAKNNSTRPVRIIQELKSIKDEIDKLAKENDNTEERSRQEKLYQQQLAPILKKLRRYFSNVANLLNEVRAQVEKCPDAQLKDRVDRLLLNKIHVKIPIFATYEVLHHRLAGFLTGFEVTARSLPRKDDFIFRCECFPSRLNETSVHFIDWRGENEMSALKFSLIESGLSFRVSEDAPTDQGDIRMKFDINAHVPVAFEFTGNPTTGKIDLTIRNAGGIDEKASLSIEKCSFFPEEVNSRLIEAVIRYAIRLPSELHGLTKVSSRVIYLKTGAQATIEEKINSIKETVEEVKEIVTKTAEDNKQYNELVQQEMTKLQKEMKKNRHPLDWLVGFMGSILSFVLSPILSLLGKKKRA
jgi:DNA-binding transcriptional regulator GbsR (MarR family)